MTILYKRSPCRGVEVLFCNGGHHFQKHLHDGWVIWLNSASAEHYSLRGKNEILEPGCIGVVEPGEIHANYPWDPENRELRSFYCSVEYLEAIREQLGVADNGTTVLKRPKLWRHLTSLHNTLLQQPERKAAEQLSLEAFGHLLQLRSSTEKPPCPQRLTTVLHHISNHLNNGSALELEHLANLAGCTPFHLIRLFREKKGISPHAFIMQLRLERARTLLKEGQPITEAAFSSGFSDQSHLTRNFKKRYGVTPAVYRKQIVY